MMILKWKSIYILTFFTLIIHSASLTRTIQIKTDSILNRTHLNLFAGLILKDNKITNIYSPSLGITVDIYSNKRIAVPIDVRLFSLSSEGKGYFLSPNISAGIKYHFIKNQRNSYYFQSTFGFLGFYFQPNSSVCFGINDLINESFGITCDITSYFFYNFENSFHIHVVPLNINIGIIF